MDEVRQMATTVGSWSQIRVGPKSYLLLAPLVRESGGYGLCAEAVFTAADQAFWRSAWHRPGE